MSDAVWRGSKAKLRRGKLKSRSKWSGERTKGQGKGQEKCKGGVSRHSRGIGWQPTDQTWLGQSAHLKLSPDIAAVLPPAAPSDEALARCRQAQEAAREAAASRQLARAMPPKARKCSQKMVTRNNAALEERLHVEAAEAAFRERQLAASLSPRTNKPTRRDGSAPGGDVAVASGGMLDGKQRMEDHIIQHVIRFASTTCNVRAGGIGTTLLQGIGNENKMVHVSALRKFLALVLRGRPAGLLFPFEPRARANAHLLALLRASPRISVHKSGRWCHVLPEAGAGASEAGPTASDAAPVTAVASTPVSVSVSVPISTSASMPAAAVSSAAPSDTTANKRARAAGSSTHGTGTNVGAGESAGETKNENENESENSRQRRVRRRAAARRDSRHARRDTAEGIALEGRKHASTVLGDAVMARGTRPIISAGAHKQSTSQEAVAENNAAHVKAQAEAKAKVEARRRKRAAHFSFKHPSRQAQGNVARTAESRLKASG